MGYYTKDKNIDEMLKECGLTLIGNNAYSDSYLLPEKNDLIHLAETEIEYENYDEDLKIKSAIIFLSIHNQFKIINWQFFFTNPCNFNVKEQIVLESIFKSFGIYYENKKFRFSNSVLSDQYIDELAKKKEFVMKLSKEFSKEFQLKSIFLPAEQISLRIKTEMVKLIGGKIVDLGIIKKIEVELPKLIFKKISL